MIGIFALLLGLLLLIVILSYQIMRTLAAVHGENYGIYRLVLFPGVVIHEMSHLLACWLTGTEVVEVNFWTATGGHVVHHKPRWPIVQPVISFAPFIVGITLIIFISQSLSGLWWLTLLKIIAVVIIAATLAPSKADFLPSIEGLLLLFVLIGLTLWLAPHSLERLFPTLRDLNQQLAVVAAIMVGIWLSLHSLRTFRRI